MKRQMLACLVAAVVFSSAPGGEKGKTDQDRIQGTWAVVTAEELGRKISDEEIRGVKFIITGDKLIFAMGEKKKEPIGFRLDPGKKPKGIDLTEGGKTMKGIYDLEGDTLKICFNDRVDGERSTEFVTMPNSPNKVLIILRREKS